MSKVNYVEVYYYKVGICFYDIRFFNVILISKCVNKFYNVIMIKKFVICKCVFILVWVVLLVVVCFGCVLWFCGFGS